MSEHNTENKSMLENIARTMGQDLANAGKAVGGWLWDAAKPFGYMNLGPLSFLGYKKAVSSTIDSDRMLAPAIGFSFGLFGATAQYACGIAYCLDKDKPEYILIPVATNALTCAVMYGKSLYRRAKARQGIEPRQREQKNNMN